MTQKKLNEIINKIDHYKSNNINK